MQVYPVVQAAHPDKIQPGLALVLVTLTFKEMFIAIMLRILHLVPHVREGGNGICNVVVDLACLQAKAGYDVGVASAGGEYEPLLTRYGVQHFHLDNELKPIKLLKAVLSYPPIVQKFQPNIVHVHSPRGVVLASIFRGLARYALIATMHSSNYRRNAILMGLATERVIAVANVVAQTLEQFGVPRKKLRVVLNGTLGSPRTRQLKEYVPLPLQRPAITTVAGMSRRKGIAELIDAFEQIALDFPETHLYLVGDGPDRSLFEAKAQSTLVANRIHFEGFQPEPQRYLLATDIFVLASHHEPFGLVLSEAREAGCAIVASDVGGIPEALDGGQAGLLVPPADSHALAGALVELLSNPNMLHKWKAQAQHNIGWLTAARVSEETLAVYRELTTEEFSI